MGIFQSIERAGRWLLGADDELRREPRYAQPEVVIHYWDGSSPEGRGIRDISEDGAYIYTSETWYPGTILRIVIQGCRKTQRSDGTTAPECSTCVPSRVVRNGEDGIAIEFVFRDKREREDFRAFLAKIRLQAGGAPPAVSPPAFSPAAVPGDKAPVSPLKAALPSHRNGQALVEFALIAPLVFLLAVNAVNFGGFIFAWITVANAARAGAQYMVMSSASPGKPSPATSGQVTTLVTNDVTSLLNKSRIVVATCTNATASSNGCTTLTDPEAPTYTLATVDVTYTYNPFIPLFSFPSLGISATLPSTSIHRKAVMRMLQ